MKKVIDLGLRLKSAFGYVASNESDSLKKQNFSKDNGITGSGIYVSNASFEEVTIRKKDASDYLRFAGTMGSSRDSDIYAPPPMISCSKAKKLIITEIDGSDSEVVERYGDRSWDIKVDGILVDMVNHDYPTIEVKRLNEFFEYNAPFIAESIMFNDLNIKSIYFTDIQIAGVAGFEDTIQYSLNARSIKPIEFFFVKGNI